MNSQMSIELKNATMQVHRDAESSLFVKQLFTGQCSKRSYTYYLWALREIYFTLEQALTRNQDHPVVSPIYKPHLFRTDALNEDLKIWAFPQLETIPEDLTKKVNNYCRRINIISQDVPHLLVAHAYVRYLGDLSGGQMLGSVLPKHFQSEDGFHFYDFSVLNVDNEKSSFRNDLDEIGKQPQKVCKNIVEEAQYAFRLNQDVFKSLEVTLH